MINFFRVSVSHVYINMPSVKEKSKILWQLTTYVSKLPKTNLPKAKD